MALSGISQWMNALKKYIPSSFSIITNAHGIEYALGRSISEVAGDTDS